MKAQEQIYRFHTLLEELDRHSPYSAIFIPADIIEAIPKKGRFRVKGLVNGTPFDLAAQSLKDGRRYFMVGGPLRRAAKIKLGDRLDVQFSLADENIVEIPEELEAVMEQDPAGGKAFRALTIGMQRSLIYYINSTKNIDLRIKRSFELLEKAKTKTLYGMKQKDKE